MDEEVATVERHVLLWRALKRWTRKGRAARQAARELGIEEQEFYQLVTSIEADSVRLAREIVLEAQGQARQEAERKAREQARSSPSSYSAPSRPANQYTSGSRLSSNR